MVKKILMFLLVIFLSFPLVACQKGDIDSLGAIIRNNLSATTSDREQKNELVVSDLVDLVIISNKDGILLVGNAEGNYSCWSLFSGKLIFPFEEGIEIDFLDKTWGFKYIQTTNSDGEITIYDIFGSTIIAKDQYVLAEVDVVTEVVEDETGAMQTYYIEVVKTLTVKDYSMGITEPKIKKFILNIEERTREEFSNEKNEDYIVKDIDYLDLYCLEGYYALSVNEMLFIYNKKDELINKINLAGIEYDNICALNGKILFQKVYLLEEENKDYTFISSGKKYLLDTFTIDILTGKKKELKVDYLIKNLFACKDEKGYFVYAYGKVKKIVARNLLSYSTNVIIDDKGKIIADLKELDFHDLTPIGNYFYDSNTGFFYNNDLNPVYTVEGMVTIDKKNEIIIVRDGVYYGVYDDELTLRLPFDYIELSLFYRGKAIGKGSDGKYYIVDLNNNKTEISNHFLKITNGLLFVPRNDVYSIIDYNNNVKYSVVYNNPNAPNFTSINNAYGEFLYTSFENNHQISYVLIDITLS